MATRGDAKSVHSAAAGRSAFVPVAGVTVSRPSVAGHATSSGASFQTAGTRQRSSVGTAHASVGVGQSLSASDNADNGSPAKRARKERCPNWTAHEVAALIDAKRAMFLREVQSNDTRELMVPDAGKWQQISNVVKSVAPSSSPRDGAACKSKWNLILAEYKRIVDFHARSGTNELSYWKMSTTQRKDDALPRSFAYDVFEHMHSWYNNRPCVNPPHTRDLMSPHDVNYSSDHSLPKHSDHGDFNDDFDEDPLTSEAGPMDIDSFSTSSHSRSAEIPSSGQGHAVPVNTAYPSSSPSPAAKSVLPPGVTPHVLSSSDTTDFDFRRRSGNTAVRRKTQSGHAIIAEATRATGNAMTSQMKELAESSREVESSKIQMQLSIFSQQMDYQRDRDRRLYEAAKAANDNARLSIEKQGEVVHCLSRLSAALTSGFQMGRRERSHEQFPVPPRSDCNLDFDDSVPLPSQNQCNDATLFE